MPNSNKSTSDLAHLTHVLNTQSAARNPRTISDLMEEEELRALRNKNAIEEQKIELQKSMFAWVQWVVSLWLAFIVLCLIVYFLRDSWFFHKFNFFSEKEVMITLLATTTANIIGLPFVIAKSIFAIEKQK